MRTAWLVFIFMGFILIHVFANIGEGIYLGSFEATTLGKVLNFSTLLNPLTAGTYLENVKDLFNFFIILIRIMVIVRWLLTCIGLSIYWFDLSPRVQSTQ